MSQQQEDEMESGYDDVIQEDDIVQVIELDDNGGKLQKCNFSTKQVLAFEKSKVSTTSLVLHILTVLTVQ